MLAHLENRSKNVELVTGIYSKNVELVIGIYRHTLLEGMAWDAASPCAASPAKSELTSLRK
jgi:hypothetical protein